MLEIICTASLALSISTCQNHQSIDLAQINQVETPDIIQANIVQKQEYLAKGKPHESRYRREADREIDELRHHDRNERNYRDRYRHSGEYRDQYRHRRRIHRDPHLQGREIDYDDEQDRYYIPQRSRDRHFRRRR